MALRPRFKADERFICLIAKKDIRDDEQGVGGVTSVYVTCIAIVLSLAALKFGRRIGTKRVALYVFVIGVSVVWAVILCAARLFGNGALFNTLVLVCSGYALGMLAMYIATNVYKS